MAQQYATYNDQAEVDVAAFVKTQTRAEVDRLVSRLDDGRALTKRELQRLLRVLEFMRNFNEE